MRKLKMISTFLVGISITTLVMGSVANAVTNSSGNDNKFNIENTNLKKYSSFPEVKNLIDNLSENDTQVNVVESYIKVWKDSNGNQFEKECKNGNFKYKCNYQ